MIPIYLTNRFSPPPELGDNRQWGQAIWSLRLGFGALLLALVGLAVLSAAATPWILLAGVLGWLSAALATIISVVRARGALPDPRPSYWALRFMLVRDVFRSRSATLRKKPEPRP